VGSIVAEAQQLAETITTATAVFATVDPAAAATNRPCVLVAPPTMDYSARTNVWPLVLLSSHPIGSLDALAQLDQLLQAVAPVVDVETAQPSSYLLTPELGALPCYILRVTT
jgi:hypothetical protein